ncbi:MAG: GTP-dependent dephospho-CoA kinase family protein [Halobacteriales archaeon]
MPRVTLELPKSLRADLKEPLGPVETDVETLLASIDGPLITVGDIVTYHIEAAGVSPAVALFDDRTEREPVAEEIEAALSNADASVANPAGTLTHELLSAIRAAIDDDAPVAIRVAGEEDLATLPAIVAAPDGASVAYGQPGEGMVHVRVTPETRSRARDLLERMDGDPEHALTVLAS